MTDKVEKPDTTKPEVQAQPDPAPEAVKPEESSQDVNWRQFRQARDAERKQREESEKKAREKEAEAAALKAALDALVNKPTPTQEQEPSEEDRIKKEIDRRFQEKEAEAEKRRLENEKNQMPQRLAEMHPDFNQVCTVENTDYLEYHYPEIAEAYRHMPDSINKWSSLYKAIKRFIPNTDSKKDQKRVDKNFDKPQSISRPGATPTGDSAPVFLDERRREENWRRMQRVMKGG